MSVGHGLGRTSAVVLLAFVSVSGACSEPAPVEVRDVDPATSDDDDSAKEEADDEDDAAPATSRDAGVTKVDAGKKSVEVLDAGSKPDESAEDASVEKAPDARSGPSVSPEGGAAGSSKDGGVSTADASAGPGGAVCALKRYPPSDGQPAAAGLDGFPVREVNGGVPVTGAGCTQQWEGIVMTQGGRGLCTAAFISDRHLISASHCYASDGAVSLKVSAPTWDNGASHTFQAQVKRSGTNMALDVSIIDLGKPAEWATPERRFVLHAGKASAVDLNLYGFGSSSASGGGAGTLRGTPNRATIRVTDDGRGTLSGKAGPAQLCTGDSGGPAFVEKTTAVLYGINQAIVPSGRGGGRTCASADWGIVFTNVSAYLPFVEKTLGKPCERRRIDDLDVAQCW